MRAPFILVVLLAMAAGSTLAVKSDLDNRAMVIACEKSLESAPQSYELLCRLAEACIDVGEDEDSELSRPYYERALEIADTLLVLHPDSARSPYWKAVASGRMALFEGGKKKVAAAHTIRRNIDLALARDPLFADAWLTRGIFFREVATLNGALKLFARLLFGGMPQGRLEDSEIDLREAVRLAPTHIYANYQLALTCLEMDNCEETLRLCDLVADLPLRDHLDPRTKKDAAALRAQVAKDRP